MEEHILSLILNIKDTGWYRLIVVPIFNANYIIIMYTICHKIAILFAFSICLCRFMKKKIGRIEFNIQCCKGIIWYLNVPSSIVILINKAVLIKGFIEIDMHTKEMYIFTMIVPCVRIYDDIFLPEV